ncbi:MAG TPA: META domain-containing protein [Ilumatobacter sp.]|jgi:heat shock protein HslJ|nr:META domain-containing protein [Ilumatobacter sp.]
MTRRHALLIAVPLSLSMVAGACGDDDADEAEFSSPLGGTIWILDNESIDVEVPDGTEEVTIAFSTDGSFAGHVACNNYTGGYATADDGGITASNVAVTEQACEPDVMAVQTTYLSDLGLVAEFEIDGDELRLKAADGAELLRYDRDE